jgi:hypothetical protein
VQSGSSLHVSFAVSSILQCVRGFGVGLMNYLQQSAEEVFLCGCEQLCSAVWPQPVVVAQYAQPHVLDCQGRFTPLV